jgi:hypothetical protein
MEVHPRREGTASPNEDIEHANAMAIDDQGSAIDEHERRSTDAEHSKKNADKNSGSETEAALRWEPADPEGGG